jgi:large subunit ribosomal protein L24
MKIRKNDNVLVIAGKDRGKKGKVRFAYPREDKVIVEGVNLQKKHSKARGDARQAGIIEREAPLSTANVMLVCAKCSKPARVASRTLEDGKKVRYCAACKEVVD